MANNNSFFAGLLILGMAGGIHAADNPDVLLHPDRYKGLTEIKGKIQAIDESSHRLTLEDSSEQKVAVVISSDTRVTDSNNHAFSWTSLKAGDPVVVYYEPKEHLALQIDRQKTIAESVLGVDHPLSK